MKKKIIYSTALIIFFLGSLFFLSSNKKDELNMTDSLNETYFDYKENPDDYIVSKAKIVDEFNPDIGSEINFFESREWIVELEDSEGNTIQAVIMRGENDKLGDTVEIAYKGADKMNIQATQLYYIECAGVIKSINLLYIVSVTAIVLLICYVVISIVKRSDQ